MVLLFVYMFIYFTCIPASSLVFEFKVSKLSNSHFSHIIEVLYYSRLGMTETIKPVIVVRLGKSIVVPHLEYPYVGQGSVAKGSYCVTGSTSFEA